MAVGESRFGNVANRVKEGEDVTFSDTHAKMVAIVSVPEMSQFNEAKDFSWDGKKAASLSSSDAFVSNNELWSEIVGLRRQIERLGELVAQFGAEGPVVKEYKCRVWGFLLKAHQATIHSKNFSKGDEVGSVLRGASKEQDGLISGVDGLDCYRLINSARGAIEPNFPCLEPPVL